MLKDILNELNDQQVASAFITQDPVQRRQDNAMSPQQLAKTQATKLAQDRTSNDPLTRRIVALRAQLAQLLIQKQNQDKQQQNNPTSPTTGNVQPNTSGTQ